MWDSFRPNLDDQFPNGPVFADAMSGRMGVPARKENREFSGMKCSRLDLRLKEDNVLLLVEDEVRAVRVKRTQPRGPVPAESILFTLTEKPV